jgi:nitrogenase-associated protein
VTDIVFYEKPGCINNTRQKRLLAWSGHSVEARDILAEAWTAETLRPFFGARPVAEWFNRASPRVKSGGVMPERLSEAEALALMCADPLLIRRPLMAALGRTECGFDEASVDAWVGLQQAEPIGEDCPRGDGKSCEAPA